MMSEDVYIKQYYEIDGFRDTVKSIQKERNEMINEIIFKLEKSVEDEQFRKYKSVATLDKSPQKQSKNDNKQQLLPSDLAAPRHIQFMGNKKFEKEEIKLKMNIMKEKDGMEKAINLKSLAHSGTNIKDTLSFASLYKNTLPQNCKVIGDFV